MPKHISPLSRRVVLACERHPQGLRKPPLLWLGREVYSLLFRKAWKGTVPPAAHSMPVMLLPGFLAHPTTMQGMADVLQAAGHRVYAWGLGGNFGPTETMLAFLVQRIAAIAEHEKASVALIGWSLGGLVARELAHRCPENVAKVVTMGSPFSGNPRSNNAWRLYHLVTGHPVEAPPVSTRGACKPPVPTIALWSAHDGIVHPRSACGWPHERDRAQSIRCTHMDFGNAPVVIAEVLRQLEMDEQSP